MSMNNTTSSCPHCGDNGPRCVKTWCADEYHPDYAQACGAAHLDFTPAPSQCIPAGSFIYTNEQDQVAVWTSGVTTPPFGTAQRSYQVDEFGYIDCAELFINVWVCGVYEVLPELSATLEAIMCEFPGHFKKLPGGKFIL